MTKNNVIRKNVRSHTKVRACVWSNVDKLYEAERKDNEIVINMKGSGEDGTDEISGCSCQPPPFGSFLMFNVKLRFFPANVASRCLIIDHVMTGDVFEIFRRHLSDV